MNHILLSLLMHCIFLCTFPACVCTVLAALSSRLNASPGKITVAYNTKLYHSNPSIPSGYYAQGNTWQDEDGGLIPSDKLQATSEFSLSSIRDSQGVFTEWPVVDAIVREPVRVVCVRVKESFAPICTNRAPSVHSREPTWSSVHLPIWVRSRWK